MAIPRYNKCTVWGKPVEDLLTGIETYGEPRVYMCEVKQGGSTKYADSRGSEFYPKTTFWIRSNDIYMGVHLAPSEGELIINGDWSAELNPINAGAEVIRAVLIHDHTKFNEPESYTIGTNA